MLHTILAQAAPPPTATPTDAMVQLITLVLLFAGMYFLVVAPQQQKKKELEKLLKEIKKGDEVLTIGGLYGIVQEISDEKIGLRVADKTVLFFQRASIAGKVEQKTDKKD